MLIEFERELDQRWYAILPEFKGDREELEMVMGADVMLDIISANNYDNSDNIKINIDTVKSDTISQYIELQAIPSDHTSGQLYKATYHGTPIEFEVWLCDVTIFVFNEFPDKLYIYF